MNDREIILEEMRREALRDHENQAKVEFQDEK